MSEEIEDVDESAEIPKQRNAGPWIAALVITLLCNLAWGAVFVLAGPSQADAAPKEGAEEAKAEEAEEDGEEAGSTTLEPLVVNLNDPTSSRYLRIGISMEIGSETERDGVEKRMVPLRDQFIRHLSSKEPAQLMSQNDKDRLREELLTKAQDVVPRKAVREVYFTEFMMQ